VTEQAVPSLDDLAAHPERVATLPADAVEKLLVKHALLGGVLLGRLLAAQRPVAAEAPDKRRLLDAAAVAERLHVPETWVRDMARQGRLPSVKLGHYVRFRAEDVDRFVAEHRQAA
jgi:excisionase family DNA binding protein